MRRMITLFMLILSLGATAAPKAFFSHDGGWFKTSTLHIDNKTYDGRWSYYDIREVAKSDPQALLYANKHRKCALWGNWLMFGGLALAITYLVGFAASDDYISDGETTAYFGIFLAGFIPGVGMRNQSRKYLHKAVNRINGVKDKRFTFVRYNIKF